jgi:heme-degrading monooxygenase HmoA
MKPLLLLFVMAWTTIARAEPIEPEVWELFAPIDPDREYTLQSTELELQSATLVPSFMAVLAEVDLEIDRWGENGVVMAYAKQAQPDALRFATLTLWRDKKDIAAFLGSDAHQKAARAFRAHLRGRPLFQQVRLSGKEMQKRLARARVIERVRR